MRQFYCLLIILICLRTFLAIRNWNWIRFRWKTWNDGGGGDDDEGMIIEYSSYFIVFWTFLLSTRYHDKYIIYTFNLYCVLIAMLITERERDHDNDDGDDDSGGSSDSDDK